MSEENNGSTIASIASTVAPLVLYAGVPLLLWSYVIDPALTDLNVFESEAEKQRRKKKRKDSKNTPLPSGVTPTISDTEAQNIADTQLQAMDGFGTDWAMIKQSLKGLNGADLVKVYRAFGVKPYNTISGRYDEPNFMSDGFVRYLSLHGWYKQELDSTKMAALRKIWKKSKMEL